MIFENGDRIVFAGDSVTDMGSCQPIGESSFEDRMGKSYVRIIKNLLSVYYPERIIRVTNSGTSGNTSRDLLERYERDVISLNPTWVSVCIGINDVWRQFDSPETPEYSVLPNEYEKNVETMILKAKDKAKGIFILSPYYIEPNKTDRMRKRMDEYGKICKMLSEKYACTFVDFQRLYDDYCKLHHSSYIAWDRVHPNQIGATLMAREFLKHCEFDFTKDIY